MATTQPMVRQETNLSRAAWNTLKGCLGNLVEWYDVYTYTVFVSYFESQFFDPADKASTVYAYAVFAITFVMRPLGSWFFGRWADRHGRRSALTFSVTVMAMASLVVAILPTRDSIGVGAALGLILCRLVQGFATGGEYGTSATYMSEAATANRRGFLSSFQYVTLVGGQVLAQAVLLVETATMSEADITRYGWRIAFGIGGLSAVVVLWLRRTMDESLTDAHLDAIRSGADTTSGTLRSLLVDHWRPLLLVFLITMGGTVCFYTYSVNAPAIVKKAFGAQSTTATTINLVALLILMCLQPIGGLVSDRIGRKPLLVFFGVGAVLYTWVLITRLPRSHSPATSMTLLLIGYVILTGYTSINALVKSELFPAHIRALGVGMGYGLANSVFGGTAPLIYVAAKQAGRVPWFIAYVTVLSFISLLVYVFALRNKDATHLDREQGHAWTSHGRDEEDREQVLA